MQGSTSCQFVYEYANNLIKMQKCYNSTTKVGMLVKFGKKYKQTKNLDQNAIHLWGQRSRKDQPEVNLSGSLGMSYDYQIWSEEPLTRV